MLLHATLLFCIALAGGAIPLIAGRSHRALHLFVSLSAGLFLGLVFLHLLPQVAALGRAAAHTSGADALEHAVEGAHVHDFAGLHLWAWVLAGALGLFLLQNVFLAGNGERDGDQVQHLTVGWSSLLGLAVHAFAEGLGLGAVEDVPELSWPVFTSISAHKLGEAFSLASVFMLAGFGRRGVLLVTLTFALVTPAGLLSGSWLVDHLSEQGVHALTALATGTFLFVSLCDLLPETFHGSRDRFAKVALVLVGIGLSYLLDVLGAR